MHWSLEANCRGWVGPNTPPTFLSPPSLLPSARVSLLPYLLVVVWKIRISATLFKVRESNSLMQVVCAWEKLVLYGVWEKLLLFVFEGSYCCMCLRGVMLYVFERSYCCICLIGKIKRNTHVLCSLLSMQQERCGPFSPSACESATTNTKLTCGRHQPVPL